MPAVSPCVLYVLLRIGAKSREHHSRGFASQADRDVLEWPHGQGRFSRD